MSWMLAWLQAADTPVHQIVYTNQVLPERWNAPQVLSATQEMGAKLLSTAAVLSVPSAVVAAERNYLINPAHPEFRHIRFLPSEPFQFDSRLSRGATP